MRVSNNQIADFVRDLGCWNINVMAKELGMNQGSFSRRIKRFKEYIEEGHEDYKQYKDLLRLPAFKQGGEIIQTDDFDIDKPPSDKLPIDQLILQRKQRFAIKQAHEDGRALIPVKFHRTEPIALFFFGDPHVDDDGCDWPALDSHIDLILKTDGMYANSIGDMRNNWIGRLQRLYGEQSTTAYESLQLAQYMIRRVGPKWLISISGNHDDWSGVDDPIMLLKDELNKFYIDVAVRFQLCFPNKVRVKVNMAHMFKGSSIYHQVQGQLREIYFSFRDDITVGGHKHVSGHMTKLSPDEDKILHLDQIAAYKVIDRYQREGRFKNQHISPCSVYVIDPSLSSLEGRITHFYNPFQAAEYLTFLRKLRARKAK